MTQPCVWAGNPVGSEGTPTSPLCLGHSSMTACRGLAPGAPAGRAQRGQGEAHSRLQPNLRLPPHLLHLFGGHTLNLTPNAQKMHPQLRERQQPWQSQGALWWPAEARILCHRGRVLLKSDYLESSLWCLILWGFLLMIGITLKYVESVSAHMIAHRAGRS